MPVKFSTIFLLLLLEATSLLAAPALDTAVARKKALSVLDFRDLGATGSLGIEAGGAISAHIVEQGRFQVVERSQMQNILKEQAFQQTECTGDACVVQMGQVLGVDWIVTGDVGQVPGGFTINLRLLDIATGRILYQKHDVFVGDVKGFLVERLPQLADQMFEVKPTKIVTDTLLNLVEGDVRNLKGSVEPAMAPQGLRLSLAKRSIVEELLPLQIHALEPGNVDISLTSEKDPSVKRSITLHIVPDLDKRAQRRKTRIRWIGSAGSAALTFAGLAGGYLNNVQLRSAQRTYNAATDAAQVRDARSRMEDKILYRNLSYGAAAVGVLGVAGCQIFF